MTCKRCHVAMVEIKGHIYHGKRKFRCPQCRRARLKKPGGQRRRGRTAAADLRDRDD